MKLTDVSLQDIAKNSNLSPLERHNISLSHCYSKVNFGDTTKHVKSYPRKSVDFN